MADSTTENAPAITELSKSQRRVLGVLVEKGLTTPDVYPLTLKAVTAGCNQKNNRDPITNYTEDQVYETLDQLREMGLVAFVHTESGRTERYRHYVRHRFTFTEPQIAVFAELLLRGRQQLGELRSRAGRMVPIESLDLLRTEVAGLESMNLVQATGPLERRGVEVDHTLYKAGEGKTLERRTDLPEEPLAPAEDAEPARVSVPRAESRPADDTLRRDHDELRREVATLRDEVRRLSEQVDELRRALGG